MGMESLLASNDEKVIFIQIQIPQFYLTSQVGNIFACLLVTGSTYRGADHPARTVQKDEGSHGSHSG